MSLVVLVVSSVAAQAWAQPRFAVEVSAGQNVGLTPYVDNVVLLQGERPVLVDELPGTGAAFDLHFLFSNWLVGGSVRFFDRETIRIHHRGTEDLPDNRIRPDGSIDDAGVDYEPIEPIRSPTPIARPGDLLVVDFGTAYRFYALDGPFSVFFPVSAAFVGVKVLETNRPTILGLRGGLGAGASIAVAPPFALFVQGSAEGLITPAYRGMADTARTSHAAGEGTEKAVVSTMAYGSALIGIQFTVQ